MKNELEKRIDHKLLREISVLFSIGLVVLTSRCNSNGLFLSLFQIQLLIQLQTKKNCFEKCTFLHQQCICGDFIKSYQHFDQTDFLDWVQPKKPLSPNATFWIVWMHAHSLFGKKLLKIFIQHLTFESRTKDFYFLLRSGRKIYSNTASLCLFANSPNAALNLLCWFCELEKLLFCNCSPLETIKTVWNFRKYSLEVVERIIWKEWKGQSSLSIISNNKEINVKWHPFIGLLSTTRKSGLGFSLSRFR